MSNVFSKVAGVEKVSMIDMRGYVSCVLFSNKCSGYHCGYCYNIDLWYGRLPELDPQEIKDYLLSRKNLIDYVVFSGGECTLHRDYLIDSAKWCKEQGFKVKVDTNGSNPNLVIEMIEDGLIDKLITHLLKSCRLQQRCELVDSHFLLLVVVQLLRCNRGVVDDILS